MNIFIGIDLGTSGCRAIAIDDNKNIVHVSSTSLPTSSSQNDHIIQNPNDWWHATKTVLLDIVKNTPRHVIKAVCVNGTSGTVLLCSENGDPLTKGYMYNDAASIKEANTIKQIAPINSAAHGASSGLAKCLYLESQDQRRNTSENQHCLNQADWIAGKLLQRFDSSDENNTLKMGYDPINRCWPQWIKNLSIFKLLPKRVLSPGETYGTINSNVAKKLGLPEDTTIVAGTTDSIAAFIATGSKTVGDAVTSLGSTLAVKLICEQPVFSPEHGIYSHRLGDLWLTGGASNSGGIVLKKYFSDDLIRTYSTQINPAISTKLNYYPLIKSGERFPIADSNKPPLLTPKPKDELLFFQGILEGIANIEKMAFEKLSKLGAPFPNKIITMGGGSKNENWRIIREKICNIPVINAKQTEAAYGSALLALQTIDFS